MGLSGYDLIDWEVNKELTSSKLDKMDAAIKAHRDWVNQHVQFAAITGGAALNDVSNFSVISAAAGVTDWNEVEMDMELGTGGGTGFIYIYHTTLSQPTPYELELSLNVTESWWDASSQPLSTFNRTIHDGEGAVLTNFWLAFQDLKRTGPALYFRWEAKRSNATKLQLKFRRHSMNLGM